MLYTLALLEIMLEITLTTVHSTLWLYGSFVDPFDDKLVLVKLISQISQIYFNLIF